MADCSICHDGKLVSCDGACNECRECLVRQRSENIAFENSLIDQIADKEEEIASLSKLLDISKDTIRLYQMAISPFMKAADDIARLGIESSPNDYYISIQHIVRARKLVERMR